MWREAVVALMHAWQMFLSVTWSKNESDGQYKFYNDNLYVFPFIRVHKLRYLCALYITTSAALQRVHAQKQQRESFRLPFLSSTLALARIRSRLWICAKEKPGDRPLLRTIIAKASPGWTEISCFLYVLVWSSSKLKTIIILICWFLC